MLGLVQTTSTWLGQQVIDFVNARIDQSLVNAGNAWLDRSRALAPMKTGRLRAEEDFQVVDRTLVLIMGAPYDIFQEFGTRNIPPHPHVRPALNEINRLLGTSIELQFNRPGGSQWHGIHAHEGGFILPKNLTRRQLKHVRERLLPVSKALHRGNVKRAKVRVRRFG